MIEVMTYSFIIGLCAAIQGVLNREVSLQYGLPVAVLINSCVFIFFSVLFYLWVLKAPHLFNDFFQIKVFQGLKWWYVLPGIFGIILVSALPYLIHLGGVQRVFIGLVSGQLFIGILIDYFKFGIPLTWQRILGALLAIVSVALMSTNASSI